MSDYYECHITIRGNKDIIKPLVEKTGWKFSCIDGDPVLGDEILCYATKHYSNKKTIKFVTKSMNETAYQLTDCEVIRQKIEYVLYDTKWKSLSNKTKKCWWIFHKWKVIKDTLLHKYEECSVCNKRRIVEIRFHGYQPVDDQWIETGKFKTYASPNSHSGVKER